MGRDKYDMFPELAKYIFGKEADIMQTIIRHLEQLAQKFVDYYGDASSPANENYWIVDPLAGTDLPQLPLLVAQEIMEITAEPINCISLTSFIKKTPERFCKYPLLGFYVENVSASFKVCYKKTDSICDNLTW